MKYLPHTFLILAIFILYGAGLHKYYVSVMEVHPNWHEKKLEIILRTFPDDMETAMKSYQKNFHKKPSFESFVKQYIKEKIRFAFDKEEVNYNILGMTTEDDQLVILMEVPFPNNKEFKYIFIEDRFLIDQFDQQKNIIHFLSSKEKKSFVLDKKNRVLRIDL